MKSLHVLLFAGALLGACTTSSSPSVPSPSAAAMTIESPAFANGAEIPQKYTCRGEGVSPPLIFAGVPPHAQELALVMSDPDAPGGDFVHWVVYGIPPVTRSVPEGEVPSGGKVGIASTGEAIFVPPCPPSGTHRYILRLSALDTRLQFETPPAKADLLASMEGHVLAEAQVMGRSGS